MCWAAGRGPPLSNHNGNLISSLLWPLRALPGQSLINKQQLSKHLHGSLRNPSPHLRPAPPPRGARGRGGQGRTHRHPCRPIQAPIRLRQPSGRLEYCFSAWMRTRASRPWAWATHVSCRRISAAWQPRWSLPCALASPWRRSREGPL